MRPNDTAIKKAKKNGNGGRRGEEGSEGEGKSRKTTHIMFLCKLCCGGTNFLCP